MISVKSCLDDQVMPCVNKFDISRITESRENMHNVTSTRHIFTFLCFLFLTGKKMTFKLMGIMSNTANMNMFLHFKSFFSIFLPFLQEGRSGTWTIQHAIESRVECFSL